MHHRQILRKQSNEGLPLPVKQPIGHETEDKRHNQASPIDPPATPGVASAIALADKCRCRPTKSGYQEVAISLESLSNRRSRHRGTAIAVDGPLDKHIAEREHHSLQACGDADAQNGTALAPIEPQLPDAQSQGSGFVAEYTDHTGCTVDIADGCGYGHTGHTQMADDDKEEIEHRIDQPGHKENIERPAGVALTAKDRGSKIVDKEKRSPKKIRRAAQSD